MQVVVEEELDVPECICRLVNWIQDLEGEATIDEVLGFAETYGVQMLYDLCKLEVVLDKLEIVYYH